jgi:hypothetical protein
MWLCTPALTASLRLPASFAPSDGRETLPPPPPPGVQVRVNTISAGPLGSRAAKAIGFIDDMIRYSYENAPVQKELAATEVGALRWGRRARAGGGGGGGGLLEAGGRGCWAG